MKSAILLGLDAGGTRSRLALAAMDGRVLLEVEGPGLDPTSGEDWGMALSRLLSKAEGMPLAAAVLGLPFHGELARVSTAQRDLVRGLLGEAAQVVNDVAIAAEGALAGRPGVLILSGTGSMAWAIGPQRQTRAGGFGDRFGDEGSAYDLGRAALQLTSWHIDGRADAPALAAAVLARLGCGQEGLIDWTYGPGGTRASIAALAVEVTRLAESRDAPALRLVDQAVTALATQMQAAARSADLPAGFDWTHAGGSFSAAILSRNLAAFLGRAPLIPRLPPLGGALLMAARYAGLSVSHTMIDTIAAGLSGSAAPR